MKIRLLFCVITLCSAAFADQPQPVASPQPGAAPQPIIFTALCPHMSEITKDPQSGSWIAKTKAGSWRTYHSTFSTKLTQFIGAQWSGANVGQLFCVYASEQRYMMNGSLQIQRTSPQLLAFKTLTYQPTGGQWKRASRGIYNCNSLVRHQCKFKARSKPPEGDILQQVESFKSDKSNEVATPIN